MPRLCLSLFALTLACAQPASAEAGGSQAREAFKEATKLFNLGRHADALPHFETAHELSNHRPSTILMLAQCERALGLFKESIGHFQEYLRTRPDDIQQIKATIELLEQELAARPVSDSRLTVHSSPSGSRVYLDGELVGMTPLDRYVVEPGAHALRVEDECFKPAIEHVVISAGERKVLELRLSRRMVDLHVGVKTDTGEPASGAVRIDGHVVGSAPNRFELSVCSSQIEVHCSGEDFEPWTSRLALTRDTEATIEAVCSRRGVPEAVSVEGPPLASPSEPLFDAPMFVILGGVGIAAGGVAVGFSALAGAENGADSRDAARVADVMLWTGLGTVAGGLLWKLLDD